jgi:hypothetical protein
MSPALRRAYTDESIFVEHLVPVFLGFNLDLEGDLLLLPSHFFLLG